jgi:aryl-alcohol dehydrogenase-like predicted oxidoreductase
VTSTHERDRARDVDDERGEAMADARSIGSTRTADGSFEVPRLVCGTMTFGSQTPKEVAARMIERCRDAGITMFDTANAYNDGDSETILGELVAPFRDEVTIATKVFNPMGPGPDDRGLSRPAIRRALDASLRRLGTDHVELYYLHQPDREVPLEESLGAMAELVDEGRVGAIGVSNHAAWQLAELRRIGEANGWPPVSISQPQYNLLSRRIEEEYAAYSAHAGVLDIVYNPLAGGLLTGKHTPDAVPEPGTRFTKEQYRTRYWNRPAFEAVERLRAIAADGGLSLLELAFRWLWSQPVVDAILLGASKLEHLEQNLAAAVVDAPLDEDTLRRCDEVWESLRGPAPAYNR